MRWGYAQGRYLKVGLGVVALSGFFFLVPLNSIFHLFSSSLRTEKIINMPFHDKPLALDPDGLALPFSCDIPAMTTLHVSAWCAGEGSLELKLTDLTRNKTFLLSTLPVLRHRDFDLSSYLRAGHRYVIGVHGKPQLASNRRANLMLEELLLTRLPDVPRYPRVDLFFFSVLALYVLHRVLSGKKLGNEFVPLFLGVLAFSVRWVALGKTAGQPLEGDAVGYFGLAQAFSPFHPFSTGIREPFFIWVQYGLGTVFGSGIFLFRTATVLMSTGAVVLGYYLAVQLSNKKIVGGIAALLSAVGQFAVWNSTRGERNELFLLLVLGYFYLLFRFRKDDWRFDALLGALAGLVSMTWLIGLVGCVLAYSARMAVSREKLKSMLVFLFFTAVFTLPPLLHQWKINGDPLTAVDVHADFYRSAEQTGEANYGGSKAGLIHFVFSRGVVELAGKVIKGYSALFLNPLNPFNKIFLGFHYTVGWSWFLYPFMILGLGVSVVRREQWIFLLLFSCLNLAPAFLDLARDPRLFLHAGFFLAYFFGRGVGEIYYSVAGRLTGIFQNPVPSQKIHTRFDGK